jgi:hypothetical protein
MRPEGLSYVCGREPGRLPLVCLIKAGTQGTKGGPQTLYEATTGVLSNCTLQYTIALQCCTVVYSAYSRPSPTDSWGCTMACLLVLVVLVALVLGLGQLAMERVQLAGWCRWLPAVVVEGRAGTGACR